MAGNTGAIDDVVREKALQQLDDLTAKANLAEQNIVSLTKACIDLNNATGNSKSFREYGTNATAAATATVKLQKEIQDLQRKIVLLQQAEQRLATLTNQNAASQQVLQRQTIATTNAIDRQAASQAKAAANAAKAQTPYQQLLNVYKALTDEARNAGIQFGTNSYQFQELSNQANGVRTRLDAVDNTLGHSQRNVGNYASGFTQGFGKIYAGIAKLANIIPGLGIGGIFLAAFEAIKYTLEQLKVFDVTLSKAALSATAFKEALKPEGEYTAAIKNLSELKENIDLAKNGFLDKDRVLKQYNETIGKTTGFVSNLDQAESQLNKNANAFIKFTLLKAVAQNALQDAAKKATEAELDRQKTDDESLSFFDKVVDVFNRNVGATGRSNASTNVGGRADEAKKQTAAKNRKEESDAADKQKDKLLSIFEDFQKKAAAIAKDNKFNFFEDKQEKPKATKDDSKENFALAIKAAKDADDEIQKNENSTYEQRLASAEKFKADTFKIIYDAEVQKTITGQKGNSERADIEKQYAADIVKINADAQKELKVLYDQQLKDAKETAEAIAKNSLDVADQFGNNQKQIIQNNADDALISLAQQYAQGLITTEKYQSDKSDIEKQAGIDADQAEIDRLKLRIAIDHQLGLDDQKDKDDLAKAERKRDKDTADNAIAQAQRASAEKEKGQKGVLAAAKAFGDQLITLGKAVVDAQFTNQLNAIQDQKDALTDQTKAQIDAENRSLDSTATKADKIAIINAKAAAQQAQLDQKAREIKQKQAEADRIFTIATIIENTAIAVTKALAEYVFPYSAIVAGLVGALGAAQIATVLATPIPKYEKGTNDAKGGLSIVGERGREYVLTPQGDGYFTPDTQSYMDIPKGSTVVPHHKLGDLSDVFGIMSNPFNKPQQGRTANDKRLVDAINNGASKTVKAMRGLRQKTPVIIVDTLNSNKFQQKRLTHFK